MSAPTASPQPTPTRKIGLILPIILMVLSVLGIAATAIYAGHEASSANQSISNYVNSGQFSGQGGNRPNGFPTGQRPNGGSTNGTMPSGTDTSGTGNSGTGNASGGQAGQVPNMGTNNSGSGSSGTGNSGSGNFGNGNFGNGQFPGGLANRRADTTPVSVWETVVIGLCAAVLGASTVLLVVALRSRRPKAPVSPSLPRPGVPASQPTVTPTPATTPAPVETSAVTATAAPKPDAPPAPTTDPLPPADSAPPTPAA